ncbi:MAG: hypothetical protein IJQ59_01885 [Bacteroidaceae bacterium]|nr:hypothetical protein [Bacteroidaceae bacterium]
MNKKLSFATLITLVMVMAFNVFVFTSCSKDDEKESTSNPNTIDNNQGGKTPGVTTPDPEGTVVMNMKAGASDNFYDIGLGAKMGIDAAHNWKSVHDKGNSVTPFGSTSWDYHAEFVSVGNINGLGNISSIPSTGWAESVAVVPGTGYIAKYVNGSTFQGTYSRIYVVEKSDDGQYFTIKYQTPFEVAFTTETKSVTLTQKYTPEGESYGIHHDANYWYTGDVKILNPSGVKIATNPEWCYAYINYGEKDGTLSITTKSQATSANERKIGTITLKNSVCTVDIEVIMPQHD